MKKNTKFIVLIIALLMLCLCLTGCSELDTMREQQAFWTEKGSIDSITYNGTEYKILPGNNHPIPLGYKHNPIFVTDPDVPVLLSNEFSTYMNLSDDGNFLTGFVYPYPKTTYISDEGTEATYCKADIYDEVIAKINEGIEYTSYCYQYWIYDDEADSDECYYYYLTDEEADAINKVAEEVKPVFDSEIPYETLWLAPLEKVSEDNYFVKSSFELYYDDYDDTYYLVSFSPSLETHSHYEVPKKMNDIFDKISEKAIEGNDYYFEDTCI